MRERVNIDEAVNKLLQGGAVILDTDTVAGIAVSANDATALNTIYEAKGRDMNKPIAWLVADESDLARYGKDVPEYAVSLAQKYWPGALTIVVSAADDINRAFVASNGTIGLRVPDNDNCRALVRKVGGALATTSANLTGAPSSKYAKDVDDDFASDVPALIEDHAMPTNPLYMEDSVKAVASTVIDCRSSRPSLIREGTIPFSEIVEVVDGSTGDILCE